MVTKKKNQHLYRESKPGFEIAEVMQLNSRVCHQHMRIAHWLSLYFVTNCILLSFTF